VLIATKLINHWITTTVIITYCRNTQTANKLKNNSIVKLIPTSKIVSVAQLTSIFVSSLMWKILLLITQSFLMASNCLTVKIDNRSNQSNATPMRSRIIYWNISHFNYSVILFPCLTVQLKVSKFKSICIRSFQTIYELAQNPKKLFFFLEHNFQKIVTTIYNLTFK